jgi:acetyltransferase-like isoleucine patch superfamily enzyme
MLFGLHFLSLKMLSSLPFHSVRVFFLKHLYRMKLGKRVHLYMGTEFRAPSRIVIGDHTIIGHHCVLDGRGGLKIGSNVNFSSEVMIWTWQHDPDSKEFAVESKSVTIGNRAWLSCRCILLPGIAIGEGAVVAAGAVVTKSVEPYTIVGGVPAKFLRKRRTDLEYKLNDGPQGWFA